MDFSFIPQYLDYFNYGVLVTIMISVCVVFFGTIIGVLAALIKRSHWVINGHEIKIFTWSGSFYVWVFRGTPMLVQIAIAFAWMSFFNGLPTVGFGVIDMDFSRIMPGIVILSLNSGAYVSEIVRAGIDAVPKGQLEAAYSLGIRPLKAMRYVILPQALKNILPALGNEFITIVKDSSLLQTIGIMELWGGATTIQAKTYIPLTPYLFAAFYYLIVTTVLTWLLKLMENRLGKGESKA